MKKKCVWTRALSLLLTAGLLTSCLGGVVFAETGTTPTTEVTRSSPPAPAPTSTTTPTTPPAVVSVEKVTLNETEATLKVGGTLTLTAKVEPENATNKDVTWESNKEDIATVDNQGKVTAVAKGTATITVKTADGGKTAQCTVTVEAADVAVTGVSLDESTISIEVGSKKQLTATINPANATNQKVSWGTSNNAVATVSSTGAVMAVATGTATITATTEDGNKTATCSVTVTQKVTNPPTGVTISPSSATIKLGTPQQFTAAITPADATGTVEWSVSPTEIATVDGSGRVTPVKPGTCTLTARVKEAPGVTASVTVNVEGVALASTSMSIRQGESKPLPAVTAFFNGSTAPVSWSSDNSSVASISGNSVNAGSVGTARLTATVTGNSQYTAVCTVKVEPNTADEISVSATIGSPFRFSDITGTLDQRCRTATGSGLNYISNLSLKSTNEGTIYRGYSSEDNPGAGIGSEGYYYSSSGAYTISNLTFVPKASFSGTATISYTGYGTNGKSFAGKISVSVTQARDVVYSVSPRVPVTFHVNDFNSVCQSRNRRDLLHVRFSLPSSSKGTLYYNYSGSTSYDGPVSGTTDYYRSGNPYISKITFVPATAFTGTVSIPYTATDTSYGTYRGTVTINVAGSGAGDVTYTVNAGSYVSLSSSDFDTVCRGVTGDRLDYVRFSLPDSKDGTLYYNYKSNGNYDHAVTTGRNYYRSGNYYLDNVYFVAKSGASSNVTFRFTGYSVDGDSFSGTVGVTVKGGSEEDLTYTTGRNSPVTFDSDDFNVASRDYRGYNLDYVRFTLPSSSRGTLYYNYSSSGSTGTKVSASTSYYRSKTPDLDSVTFVPASGYTGTVSIAFRGWDTQGSQFDGTVTVKVGASGGGDISYSVAKNGTVDFQLSDFNDYSNDQYDYNLDYVQFTLPSSSRGTLYHNYKSSSSTGTKVSASTRYYRNSSPYLRDITFVPYSNYTGTVEIDFQGRDTDNNRITGTVTISVGSGGVVDTDITYTTARNTAVSFRMEDFNQASDNHRGYHLNYVTFSLPSSSRGTLYYNYKSSSSTGTKVSASTKYYRNSSSYVDNVSFVPASGYTGSVEMDYVGYDTDGNRFTGTVTVRVGATDGSDTVSYKTTIGQPVTFDSDAFNQVSRDFDGNSFDYVRFTLPSSSVGTLYYNYGTGGSVSNPVKANTSYYRNGSPYLYNITFVPANGFTGTAEIAFTGWDTDGEKFTGKVQILVERPVAATIRYTVAGGQAVTFQQNDFHNVGRALMGEDVVKVRFTPPNGVQGTLYYGYRGPGAYDGVMSGGLDCYVQRAPYLYQVAFVPALGFGGVVSIPYTAENANGRGFSGVVEITVQAATEQFSDMAGFDWALPAVQYLYQAGVVKGTSAAEFSPKGPTSRGDFALMIVRAFRLPSTSSQQFADVPVGSYYSDAIHTARALGIVQGDGNSFRPNYPVTRQDAMVMLQRAMRVAGDSVYDGSANDLTRFSDRGSVSSYAVGAVGAMVRMSIVQGDSSGRLNPKAYITRAEMAVILYRALNI